MTEKEIIKLAKDTRDAQKSYFKTHSSSDLQRSKQLERLLDAKIKEYFDGVATLF